MSTKVKIFYSELKRRMGDPDSVTVEGNTVGECLRDLTKKYPDTGKLLFNSQGKLRQHVFVFVNAEGMNKADLNKTVTEDDELILAALMLGG